MSRLKPLGTFNFTPSPSSDVVRYYVYWSANRDALLPANIDYDTSDSTTVAAVAGTTEYSIELAELDLVVDQAMYFTVVSEDDAGNLSDPLPEPIEIQIDQEPPLPPTSARYVPA